MAIKKTAAENPEPAAEVQDSKEPAKSTPEEAPKEEAPVEEMKYTADEFAAAAETIFGKGIGPDLVKAAFSRAGVKELSVTEAKDLVTKFAKKEVER